MPLLRSNCFPSHSEDQHAEDDEEKEDDDNPPRKYPRYHRRKHDANTTPKRNANANPRDDGDEDASLRLLFMKTFFFSAGKRKTFLLFYSKMRDKKSAPRKEKSERARARASAYIYVSLTRERASGLY
jgi:hypothetical protein